MVGAEDVCVNGESATAVSFKAGGSIEITLLRFDSLFGIQPKIYQIVLAKLYNSIKIVFLLDCIIFWPISNFTTENCRLELRR